MYKCLSEMDTQKSLSIVFAIEIVPKLMRAMFPLVYDGDHTTNVVGASHKATSPSEYKNYACKH